MIEMLETTRDSASTERVLLRRARVILKDHWQIVTVLVAFGAAAFVVPAMANVATTDDWGYTRSVEILHSEHRLTVFPVVAATAVFQIGWGWLFAALFGMSLGIVRVSTIVMVAIGALALYGALRELGVSRERGALGVAAYLFNPLTFSLSYTFMTDPHFASLLMVSTWGYLRGLRDDRRAPGMTIFGSFAAACAFLVRQQGALIPLAVFIFLVATGRVRANRAGILALLRVTLLPVLATAGYYLWLREWNDVPAVQQGFFDEMKRAGLGGFLRLSRNAGYISLVYLGFFLLPVVIAALPRVGRSVRDVGRNGWTLFSIWASVLTVGLVVYGNHGARMPYVGQFVGTGGLGPPDVLGSRPRLLTLWMRDVATITTAVAAVVVALLICRRLGAGRELGTGGLIVFILAWQAIGILPPSFHYLRRGYSLDRYLLPLLPLGLCLLLWAVRDLRLTPPLGWIVIACFAVYSIAGTRDYLVYLDAVWNTARDANAAGVSNLKLDAGAAWDGYHLYTYGLEKGMGRSRTKKGPWWIYFYGKPTDSTYIVSSRPLPGYYVIWIRGYSSWLQPKSTPLYLLRRAGMPGPP